MTDNNDGDWKGKIDEPSVVSDPAASAPGPGANPPHDHDDRQDKSDPAAGNDPAASGPAPGANPPPKKKPSSSIYGEVVMWGLVGLVWALWGATTSPLLQKTYNDKCGEPDIFRRIAGVVVAFGAGIFVGYPQWLDGVVWYSWLWHASATAAAGFVYGFPLFHVSIGQFTLKFRKKLWSKVSDGSDTRWDSDTDGKIGNPRWFSRVLFVLSSLAMAYGCFRTGVFLVDLLHAYLPVTSTDWIGSVVAGGAILGIILVGGAILAGCFRIKIKFGLGVTAVGVVVGWLMSAVSRLRHLHDKIAGQDWSAWGNLPGIAVGLVVGGGIFVAWIFALRAFRVRLIAVVAAAAGTAYLAPTFVSLTSLIPLGPFAFLGVALPALACGICFLAIEGFIFPGVHIFITHAGLRLADIPELLESVYGEPRGGYREFPLQVLTIAGTILGAIYGTPLVTGLFGWTNPVALYATSTVGSIVLVYLIGYALFDLIGSAAIGLWGAIVGAKYAFDACVAYSYVFDGSPQWVTTAAPWAAAVIAFLALFVAIIPLILLGIRTAIMGDTVMMVRNFLVEVRETILEKLFDAADETYQDRTSFAKTTALFNAVVFSIIALIGAGFGLWWLGFAPWLAIAVGVLLLMAVFTFGGQFFLRRGIAPVHLVAAGVVGVGGGVLIHGAEPAALHWLASYGIAVVGGIVVAAVTFVGPLAWWYVFWKAVYEKAQGARWLLPVLEGVYNPVWKRAANFRENFMTKYRAIQESMAEFQKRFNERYAEFQARLNERSKKK